MAEKFSFKPIARASIVGINIVVATFVGLAIGYFLDRFFGTRPWLTLIFFIIGVATGFRDLFKIARNIDKDDT